MRSITCRSSGRSGADDRSWKLVETIVGDLAIGGGALLEGRSARGLSSQRRSRLAGRCRPCRPHPDERIRARSAQDLKGAHPGRPGAGGGASRDVRCGRSRGAVVPLDEGGVAAAAPHRRGPWRYDGPGRHDRASGRDAGCGVRLLRLRCGPTTPLPRRSRVRPSRGVQRSNADRGDQAIKIRGVIASPCGVLTGRKMAFDRIRCRRRSLRIGGICEGQDRKRVSNIPF
jgi:hypothetical protein